MYQDNMSLGEHINVMRSAIIKIVIATLACSLVAFYMKEQLFGIVLAPRDGTFATYRLLGRLSRMVAPDGLQTFSVTLVSTGLAQQFAVHMKVAAYAGIVASSPYSIYVLVSFIAPALYDNEKRYIFPVVTGGYTMFIAGMLLSYFLIFPFTLRFLGTYQIDPSVSNMITLSSYIDTMMMMTVLLGVIFELPVVCWVLGKLGFLSAAIMRRYRRHAIVATFIIAAVITPTSDVFTLTIVAVPVLLLYEASALLVPKG